MKTSFLESLVAKCGDSFKLATLSVSKLVNCRVRSARTAADMSQDGCHRQRQSLSEFRSGRAKKTRGEHAHTKTAGSRLLRRGRLPTPPPLLCCSTANAHPAKSLDQNVPQSHLASLSYYRSSISKLSFICRRPYRYHFLSRFLLSCLRVQAAINLESHQRIV